MHHLRDINLRQPTDEELQLVVVEDGDVVLGDKLPETLQERANLTNEAIEGRMSVVVESRCAYSYCRLSYGGKE